MYGKYNGRRIVSCNELDADFIVKFPFNECENINGNEHFFMYMAYQCGINTSISAYIPAYSNFEDLENPSGYFISEKFTTNESELIHFIDLLKEPSVKNTSLANFLDLFKKTQLFGSDEHKNSESEILKQFYYSNLIGNYDLHARNIAVLRDNLGYYIAPAYDISCTQYADSSTKSAIAVNGKNKDVEPIDIYSDFERYSSLESYEIASIMAEINENVRAFLPQIKNSFMSEEEIDFIYSYIDNKIILAERDVKYLQETLKHDEVYVSYLKSMIQSFGSSPDITLKKMEDAIKNGDKDILKKIECTMLQNKEKKSKENIPCPTMLKFS